MIQTRVVSNASGTKQLCETYSTENYKLRQVETEIVYGSSVIDVIAGYDEQGFPYSKFSYTETDEYDIEETSETEQKAQAYDILMGVTE